MWKFITAKASGFGKYITRKIDKLPIKTARNLASGIFITSVSLSMALVVFSREPIIIALNVIFIVINTRSFSELRYLQGKTDAAIEIRADVHGELKKVIDDIMAEHGYAVAKAAAEEVFRNEIRSVH